MKQCAAIRRAKPSEGERLTGLAMRSKAYWGYSEAFMAACRAELSVSPNDIGSSSADYFVCEDDESVVGYCVIWPIADHEDELEALFVEPRYIGHGYGRLLMNQAKTAARQRGAKSLLI